MKLPRRRFLQLAAAAVAIVFVTLFGHTAWSQTIKIIVPYPAGGVADTLARMLADQIGRVQGPPMIIENRAGAGSVIGTEAAARAAPDRNTVLITSNGLLTNPHLRKVGYDALTSFDPICYLSRVPSVIAVNSTSRYRTLADFIDAARTKPGDLTLAATTAGIGQIAFEMLKRTADVNVTFVPYAGDAPAVSALLGEHVTSLLFTYAAVAAQVSAGKLRVLATFSQKRIAQLPDVPTISESGFGEIGADSWYGLFAPARAPKDTFAQLARWFIAALQAPEIKAKFAVLGHEVANAVPDGYTLLLVGSPNAVNATYYDKLAFNLARDIVSVASIARTPLIMVVHPSIPARTVPELIAYAKANPEKINMASGGNGNTTHVAGELFKMMTGIKMLHVPYRGGAPAITDLLAGQMQVYFGSMPELIEHIRANKLRALAVTTTTRVPLLPDIPILGEIVAGYEASGWTGVGAPKGTPIDVVEKLNLEINAALAAPKMKARLAGLGGTVLAGSPADFGRLIADETEKWARVINFAGIKPQ